MRGELDTWERQYFVPSGGDPLLFYVVYGDVDSSVELSRKKYRSEGIPEGIDVMSYNADSDLDVITSFREGYVWDKFVAKNPELAAQVEGCQSCIIIRGTPTESRTLNYLRDTVGLITFMLNNGGCSVFDPQILRWWSPSEWKSELFSPEAPVPTRHVVILKSEEKSSNRFWFHTRGMRKFGRPDISLHDVTEENEESVINIINKLIYIQAFGEVSFESQKIRVQIFEADFTATKKGDLNNLDFNNYHIEVNLN
jgi:hypothetical protein